MGVGSVRRLDAASFGSRLYLARLRSVQDAFAARLRTAVPGAPVERRYGVVLDALAVRLPARSLARVERLPGVAAVYPVATYRAAGRHGAGAGRCRPALGRRPLDRRAGHQGRRSSTTASTPARPFLAPAGLRAPRRLPARAAALHERAA